MQLKANDFSSIKNDIPLLVETYGAELAAAQLQIEHDAYVEGEIRFNKALERAAERGELADNKAAKPYVTKAIELVEARLAAKWLASDTAAAEAKEAGKRFRRENVEILLRPIDAGMVSLIAIKTIISQVMKNRTPTIIQAITGQIGKAVNNEVRFGAIRDAEAKDIKRIVDNGLKKRVGAHFKVSYMQAVESHLVADGVLEGVGETWDKAKRSQVGLFLLECVIEATGWFKLERYNEGTTSEMHCVEPTEVFSNHFTERAFNLAGMSPVLQPCVIPPKPWTSSTNGGYWAKGRAGLQLVRTFSKAARSRYKNVDMPAVYAAVNLAQNTAWQVNTRVLDVLQEVLSWDNPVAGLPVTEMQKEEITIDETMTEAEQKFARKRLAAQYRNKSAAISRRLSLESTLSQAVKFKDYEAIYFPHNMDWRGRIYALPSFNPQGNDITKGLLKFADHTALPLGADGAYWLAVHGANCMGFDKASLDERVQYVKDREEMILSCAANPTEDTRWADQDAPWTFLAFCFEWAGYKAEGNDYKCGLAVALDGTCSGLQHFSAMLRDETGGAAVNLMSGMTRQDIYGIVADKVNEMVAADLENGGGDEMIVVTDKETGAMVEKLVRGTKALAEAWTAFGINRNVTKRPVMTLAYGASKFGFVDMILEDTINPANAAGESPFSDCGHTAARYLSEYIWTAVSTTVVAAVEAMKWLQSAARLLATPVKDANKQIIKPALPISWVTPDGFPVWQAYVESETRIIRTLFMGKADITMKINMEETQKLLAKKQENGCAPNFVHSNDACHLRKTVVHANEAYGITQFALIHDSFGAMPAQTGALYAAVRESMVAMYENNDVIADFYEQFADQLHESQLDKMPAVPAKGNLDITEILKSEFAFS